MANTFIKLATNTLSAPAASVTFSGIPSLYNDFLVKASLRSDYSGNIDNLNVTFNGVTTNQYSYTILRGNGSAGQSFRAVNTAFVASIVNAATSTASVFTNVEMYVPAYLVAQNKPLRTSAAQEDNVQLGYTQLVAQRYVETTAISSVTFTPLYGSWIAGCTFWLYGIKNS